MIRAGTLPRGPVLPPQRDRAARCRRWPSGPTTSCRWPSTSSPRGKRSARPRARRCCAHAWPGNVRELKNAIAARGAAGARRRRIDAGRPRPAARRRVPRAGTRDDEPDRDAIEPALARAGGVVAQAAAELGLSAARRCTGAWSGSASRATDMRPACAPPLVASARRFAVLAARADRGWSSAVAVLLGHWLLDEPWLVAHACRAAGRAAAALSTVVRARVRADAVAVPRAGRHGQQLPRRRLRASACAGTRNDELGDLVDAHNELGDVLREQRLAPGPARAAARHDGAEHAGGDAAGATPRGRDRATRNLAARQLLNDGRKLEGHALRRAAASARAGRLREAVRARRRRPVHRRRRGRAKRSTTSRGAASASTAARTSCSLLRQPHRRAAPPGSADLEEGDPRDQPRAEQLAGADRLARAFGRASWSGAASYERAADMLRRPSRSARATWKASSAATRASPSCRRRALEPIALGALRRAAAQRRCRSRSTATLPEEPARVSTRRRWSRRCSTC